MTFVSIRTSYLEYEIDIFYNLYYISCVSCPSVVMKKQQRTLSTI